MSIVTLVPARDEAARVGETVRALRSIEPLGVVVIDGGSRDGTEREARAAGARVLRSGRGSGKGDALEAAVSVLPGADVYLFADADLGASASGLRSLLEVVSAGGADMAVAILPDPPTGGFGLIKGGARAVVRALSGFDPRAPLSGQRAITAECLRACRPIASGFGAEVGLTIDAVRMGFRVVEIPVEVRHRYTRRDVAGFVHRGRQGLDALRAVAPRALALR